jgi:hypothetical protein
VSKYVNHAPDMFAIFHYFQVMPNLPLLYGGYHGNNGAAPHEIIPKDDEDI